MAGWTNPLELLEAEVQQRRSEGCQIPGDLTRRIGELTTEERWQEDRVFALYDALAALPEDAGLAAREPNELDAIRRLRPEGPRNLRWQPADTEALDRFHGAWTGRAVGCALGKPVEGIGFGVLRGGFTGRKDIKAYLQKRGDWPLDDYFSGQALDKDDPQLWSPASQREHIAYMEPDDDIHYSLVGLAVMESHGPGFTWQDIANYWSEHIPYAAICTAETQGILNYWNKTSRLSGESAATPEYTRRYRNPYREWIGAQIRVDGFAWCAAGNPELAAEFAWRDAHWTHERNGIYGAMFFAALQAAAFVENDWQQLVVIGLSEIPVNCRLALAIRELLGWIDEAGDWESALEMIENRYRGMSPVHAINNALVCIVGMAFGALSPHESICITVAAGLDTDCNGATVGNVVGAIAGRSAFNSPLADRLNDTIKPSMIGFSHITMSALSERTLRQWKRVQEYRGG